MLINSIVWDPSKGIDLGFFMIRYYSMMYLIAFILGWYIMKRFYKRDGIDEEKVDSIFIYAVLGTLIGARLGHVLFYQTELIWQDPLSVILPFQFVPEFAFTGFQGLASHGAAIGIVVAMFLYSRNKIDKSVLWVLDRVVIPTSSGAVFIRFGNFLNSEIVGKPTNSDYGVVFKQLGENFPRHPAQLYEAASYLVIFIILWILYWKTEMRYKTGRIFGLFMIMLWTVRFFIEFIKKAQVGDRADWILNTGQWLSIPGIIIGFYFLFRTVKSQKSKA
jgi:prolipoprotein diacylglyceryl transferase